jgi:hypothetical protein
MEPNRSSSPKAIRRDTVSAALARTVAVAAAALACSAPASAETRGYVISWFATATNNPDHKVNCPENRNGGQVNLALRNLQAIGYSKEEAQKMVNKAGGMEVANADRSIRQRIVMRGQVDGKPASIYNYPDTVADPNIEMVTGKFAYGFDLGGTDPAAKFEDPDTHEKIDNQLWRAVGCTESFVATPPVMPYPEELAWQAMTDSAPAWLIRITGENLNKDGPVTITLDRSTRHPERDATGAYLSAATYIIDPNPRSHNVLQGVIHNGVLTIQPHEIFLEAEMPYYSEIAMRNTHMRMKLETDGRLTGYWGGYQNWRRWIYMYTARSGNNADTIGLFWAVKKMADSDSDPATGEKRYISSTYRMEAVPAYLAQPDGVVVAAPVFDLAHAMAQTPAAAAAQVASK